jgi:hypothetical protein
VVRVRSFLEIGKVAARAVRRRASVFSSYVTLGALDGGVRTGQRERRVVVIESRRNPADRGVTNLAFGWKPGSLVIRIRRVVVVGQMARHARRGRAGKPVVYVARGTRR